jgi:hypothetical protein
MVAALPEFGVWEYVVSAFEAAGIQPPRITVATLSLPMHRHLATGRSLAMLPVSMLQFGAKPLSKPRHSNLQLSRARLRR